MPTSPFFNTVATISLAPTSGVRSGRLYSDRCRHGNDEYRTTLEIVRLECESQLISGAEVFSIKLERAVSAGPKLTDALALMSNPMVTKCLPNSIASGRPTYPGPTSPMRQL